MSASAAALQRVGQTLWLDQINRGMLDDGTLASSIRRLKDYPVVRPCT
jgi:hypothetical protein